MKKIKTLAFTLLIIAPLALSAQDDVASSDRKNIIKLVLTPRMLYSDAYVLSYERVMKPYQTMNITAGLVKFPKLFDSSNSLNVQENTSSSGFTFGFDYRFYMHKENKFTAPHGIYLGPYISYYQFENDRLLRSISSGSDVRFVTDIAFLNIGAQLGYQFVLNDRWTFDFIFVGPAITNYKLGLDLQGTLSVDEENELVQELLEQFPLLKDLIDDEDVTVKGTNTKWAPGYRFTAMVGYKFSIGKKK